MRIDVLFVFDLSLLNCMRYIIAALMNILYHTGNHLEDFFFL